MTIKTFCIIILLIGAFCLPAGKLVAVQFYGYEQKVNIGQDGWLQNPDPKKKEIITSVIQSASSETITLYATSSEDAPNAKASLYSLLGKLIEVSTVRNLVKNDKASFPFSTIGLPNGAYFVVLEANGQRIVNKVVLSR